MEIRLKNVSIHFPSLDIPKAFGGGDGEPAYQARFAIEPGSENHKAIKEAIAEVAKGKWEAKAAAFLKRINDDKKTCYLESPYTNSKSGEVYDGFEGVNSISARSTKFQPTIYDLYGKEITDPREIKSAIYSGCIVHAKIAIWAQDSQWGRRINATLSGVRFAGEGRRLGGSGPATADDFADLAPEESAEELL